MYLYLHLINPKRGKIEIHIEFLSIKAYCRCYLINTQHFVLNNLLLKLYPYHLPALTYVYNRLSNFF